ncbi:Bromodomain-containing protein, partial [Syncephalis pseudoplumigaleata]
IWRDLANHRYASIFAQPIRRQQAPGYYDIVRRPMDLNTVRKRIRDSKINTTDEFHHDMLLIFQNAIMYNPIGSEIYQMAQEM